MFAKHVIKDLSAYCHGELSAHEASELAEHLIGCSTCRAAFEEIKFGVRLAEHAPEFKAPETLWNALEAQLDTHAGPEPLAPSVRRLRTAVRPEHATRFLQPRFLAIAASVILAVGVAAIWFYLYESRPSWAVSRIDGSPKIGSSRINEKSRLAVGEWLETDNVSRAKILVGSIGQVEIDPNSRVKLLETRPTEHRLELAQGRLTAHIWAPPRLFFVDTPSGVAADLGCAYTLEVDQQGGSLLRVTSGWVALQLKDRESMVPSGAACATRPGVGPGTPYFEDASEKFRHALAKVDFESQNDGLQVAALNEVLSEARPRDTLTLWHLLSRVDGDERSQVYERLAALNPPPAGVTREGVLQLNDQMLQKWKSSLESSWSNDSRIRKAWIKIWTGAVGRVKGLEGKK